MMTMMNGENSNDGQTATKLPPGHQNGQCRWRCSPARTHDPRRVCVRACVPSKSASIRTQSFDWQTKCTDSPRSENFRRPKTLVRSGLSLAAIIRRGCPVCVRGRPCQGVGADSGPSVVRTCQGAPCGPRERPSSCHSADGLEAASPANVRRCVAPPSVNKTMVTCHTCPVQPCPAFLKPQEDRMTL